MRRELLPLLVASLVVFVATLPLHADDYLKNTDFKEGFAVWHGQGDVVFLKPDNTEGEESDPGAVQVLKIALGKGSPHTVTQDIDTNDNPDTINVSVDIYATPDFARSTFPSDYTDGLKWKEGVIFFGWDGVVPPVDCWVTSMPDYVYRTVGLTPGAWKNLKFKFSSYTEITSRTIGFSVPPGTGIVYIRNPS